MCKLGWIRLAVHACSRWRVSVSRAGAAGAAGPPGGCCSGQLLQLGWIPTQHEPQRAPPLSDPPPACVLRVGNSWRLLRVVILLERRGAMAAVLGYSQRLVHKLLSLLHVLLQTLHFHLQLDVLVKDEIADQQDSHSLSRKGIQESQT